ncbi:MAG: DUF2177 family protein [Vicinamibacterales bacterium]
MTIPPFQLPAILTAIGGFILVDGIWLGLVMRGFYRRQLAPIARMAGDGMAPLWWAALPVYVLLGVGIGIFVVPRADSPASAAWLGGVFGLVVYGVYDLTNYSTLAHWPAAVTLADILWGVCASAAVAAGVFALTSR